MKNKAEWYIFISSGVFLIIVYGSNIMELLRSLLQWIFVGTGAVLIIEYNIKERLEKRFNGDGNGIQQTKMS